jgi:hypothetical protein
VEGSTRGAGRSVAVVERSVEDDIDPTLNVGATDDVDAALGTEDSSDIKVLLDRARRAQEQDGDLRASRRWYEAAYRAAESAGDVTASAQAALGLGGVWVHEHRTATGSGLIQARLEHVLSLLEPGSSLALRVQARLAAESDYRAGEHQQILAVLEQARMSKDPIVRAEALSYAHHCVLGPGHGALRRGLADELIGEGARTGRRTDLLMGLLWQVVDMFLDGDPHAERRLGELRALLAEDNHLAVGYVVSAIEVMLAIRAGLFEKAEQLARESCERGAAAGDVDATGWFGAQLVAIRWYQGRLPELLPMLAELVHSPTLSAVDNSYFAALALAAAMAGDERTAAGALATLRGRNLADLPRSSSWLVTMYGVIEAAELLDNVQAAARAYELLRPYADKPMMPSLGVACFGSVHHALGIASLTMGATEQAVTHLREAVHANLALAHWPAVVSSRMRYAEALTRRGLPGDDADAREQRVLAEELASTLGVAVQLGDPTIQSPARAVTCTRQGRRWRVDVGSRTVLVDHSVGMLHLAVLTANPGVEVPAIELVAGVDALGQAAKTSGLSAQPVLDRAAIQRYRERLSELRDEIDDLQLTGDIEGAARATTERDWLLAELAAGTGLAGRTRAFSDSTERARLAVGKAIRRAITHIEKVDSVVGAHLRGGVHTGTRCWYRPV